MVGPGVIFINVLMRNPPSQLNNPWIPRITTAVYKTIFPLDSLKYIFSTDIMNIKTVSIVGTNIFTHHNMQERRLGRMT